MNPFLFICHWGTVHSPMYENITIRPYKLCCKQLRQFTFLYNYFCSSHLSFTHVFTIILYSQLVSHICLSLHLFLSLLSPISHLRWITSLLYLLSISPLSSLPLNLPIPTLSRSPLYYCPSLPYLTSLTTFPSLLSLLPLPCHLHNIHSLASVSYFPFSPSYPHSPFSHKYSLSHIFTIPPHFTLSPLHPLSSIYLLSLPSPSLRSLFPLTPVPVPSNLSIFFHSPSGLLCHHSSSNMGQMLWGFNILYVLHIDGLTIFWII